MPRFNLDSPKSIQNVCDLNDLDNWLQQEIAVIPEAHVQQVLKLILADIDQWVRWPKAATLLWQGCTRTDYHKYTNEIKAIAKKANILLDSRANGPAVAAFLLAGGARPQRFGSHNAWSIHHIYDGKFPYPFKNNTLHAVKHGDHFTNSAGLVAVHPISDAICNEIPFFAWYLRAKSFQKFSYDPDGVFI